jgi:hypothetical protein
MMMKSTTLDLGFVSGQVKKRPGLRETLFDGKETLYIYLYTRIEQHRLALNTKRDLFYFIIKFTVIHVHI